MTAQMMSEHAIFSDAQAEIRDRKNIATNLATIIQLSIGATSHTLRRWASAYLRERFDMVVSEMEHEAQSETGSLSR